MPNKYLEQYEKDIDDLTKVIQLNPDSAEAYYNRGEAHFHFEQYDKAIDDYTKAIELNPYYAEAYIHRGIAYYELADYEAAHSDFSTYIDYIEQESERGWKLKLADAYYYRGNCRKELGYYVQALKDFYKLECVYEASSDGTYEYPIDWGYLEELDADVLVKYLLEDIFSNDPYTDDPSSRIPEYKEFAQVDNYRDNHELAQHNYELAQRYFEKAIEFNQKDKLAYFYRGVLHEQMAIINDPTNYAKEIEKRLKEAAINSYTQAIQLDSQYADAYEHRATIYLQSGDYTKALEDYNKVLELDPDNQDVINYRSNLLKEHPELKP